MKRVITMKLTQAIFIVLGAGVAILAFPGLSQAPPLGGVSQGETRLVGGGYAGSESCEECHKRQYQRYMKFSRKAKAYESVERMKSGLTEQDLQGCYQCHTTGYGKVSGFESREKTPYLADVGCEACHGPGKLHTETMDMAHIVKTVTIDVCEKCHADKNANVKSFRFKSVIYAGAH